MKALKLFFVSLFVIFTSTESKKMNLRKTKCKDGLRCNTSLL